MEKPELLKKFEAILDEARRTGMWGTVEIEIQRGEPVLLRTLKTEKLQESTGGNTRAKTSNR